MGEAGAMLRDIANELPTHNAVALQRKVGRLRAT